MTILDSASQVFPTFEIDPPIGLQSLATSPIYVKLISVYPAIEPYEPVYPYLIIYPQTRLTAVDDYLLPRPVSPHNCPPDSLNRQRSHPSRMGLASGQQPDEQHTLASNTPMTTTAPSENRATRGKLRRTHLDLHLAVFGIQSMPALFSGPLHRYTPRRKPQRTHHDLHLLVFSTLSQEGSQKMEDHVPELQSRSPPVPVPAHTPVPTPALTPAPTPVTSRQRSRSGTVSSRPSPSFLRPARDQVDLERSTSFELEVAEMATARFTGISRLPSVYTISSSPLTGDSSSPSDSIPDRPVPTSNTVAPPLRRGISGLPSSPAYNNSLLNRVRSINSQGVPLAVSTFATEPRGLDRSKSLSDANRVGANQHSTVLERAKMFALLGKSIVLQRNFFRTL